MIHQCRQIKFIVSLIICWQPNVNQLFPPTLRCRGVAWNIWWVFYVLLFETSWWLGYNHIPLIKYFYMEGVYWWDLGICRSSIPECLQIPKSVGCHYKCVFKNQALDMIKMCFRTKTKQPRRVPIQTLLFSYDKTTLFPELSGEKN